MNMQIPITYPAPGLVTSLGRARPWDRPWEILCDIPWDNLLDRAGGSSNGSPAKVLSPSILRPRSQFTCKYGKSAITLRTGNYKY